ncbi:MAG: hypothetical protein K6F32_01335 [Bacilli bacterium]|nr:hypothetical protein [Bacilli bacterium]
MKIKQTILTLSVGLLAASCGGPAASSEPSAASSEPETVSSSVAASSEGFVDVWDFVRNTKNGKYIEMTLAKDHIPEGTNFYDACSPKVEYVDGDEREDYSLEKLRIEFTVVDRQDPSKTYSAGQALPAGYYYAEAKAPSKSRYDRQRFYVEEATVEKAAEGKGYHTVAKEKMEFAAVGKHANLGALGDGKFPSVGKPTMIVIPVQFTNSKFEDESEAIKVLERAFFASNEELGENQWESLKSYYYKASYGRLDIQGEVSPVYTANMTTDEYASGSSSSAIMQSAIEWLASQHGLNPRDYDYDKDGYIDGVEMVYMTNKPTPAGSGDSTWWNYCTVANTSPNLSKPAPHRLFWSRYDYVQNAYYAGTAEHPTLDVDAHTIVHETGHMMGLNDYYSYATDSQGGKVAGPAGCVDMMDQNVGDHNAYSKMMYNWVDAKVVDGSSKNFEITLSSYTDTGDFLVLRDTIKDPWNETPYDEYLIIEYYTPTGVNKKDSEGYPEWQQTSSTGGNAYGHGGTYEIPGLQVFHVDSRLGATWGTYDENDKLTQTGRGYVDTIYDDTQFNEDGTYISASSFPHSNTVRSGDGRQSIDYETGLAGDYCEIHAIFSSPTNSLDSSTYYSTMGNTANLFGLESYGVAKTNHDDETKTVYGGNTFSRYNHRDYFLKDLVWDDGSTCTWTFSVTAQTDDSITLHFIDNSAI